MVIRSRIVAPALLAVMAITPSTAKAERTVTSVILNGVSSGTLVVPLGGPIIVEMTVTTTRSTSSPRSDDWMSASWRIGPDENGPFVCERDPPQNFTQAGTHSSSFIITATTTGTYQAYFIAHARNTCASLDTDGGDSEIFSPPIVIVVQSCSSDAECNDGEVCNGTEVCDLMTGLCSTPPRLADGTPCDDGQLCTTDTCFGGVCTSTATPGCCTASADCADSDACTADRCDVPTGTCRNERIKNCCLTELDCDDQDPCTADICPVAGALCEHFVITNCPMTPDAGSVPDGFSATDAQLPPIDGGFTDAGFVDTGLVDSGFADTGSVSVDDAAVADSGPLFPEDAGGEVPVGDAGGLGRRDSQTDPKDPFEDRPVFDNSCRCSATHDHGQFGFAELWLVGLLFLRRRRTGFLTATTSRSSQKRDS